MIAKVTQRTEFGPLRALPTARRARVERGNRLRPTRSCAWIAVVEAHHVAIRSSFHSSMKAENWFQLRNVGVATTREPGFGRASSVAERSRAGRFHERGLAWRLQARSGGRAQGAQQVKYRGRRA
jgi:hypothetical protein